MYEVTQGNSLKAVENGEEVWVNRAIEGIIVINV
jgi:hypothetical protein